MILASLESPNSPLSNGAKVIEIRWDLKKLYNIEVWTIRRPTAFLNFGTLLESGITFIGFMVCTTLKHLVWGDCLRQAKNIFKELTSFINFSTVACTSALSIPSSLDIFDTMSAFVIVFNLSPKIQGKQIYKF